MSVLTWTAAASLAAWLWLLVGQGLFWRTDIRLPPGGEPDSWPSVAVLVPARDEAAVLPSSLPTLLGQDYPGRAEIILVDDGSRDGTGDLALRLARARPDGLPLSVHHPGDPEAGWTGKLWALRHAMSVARERTDAEFLLLTDADIAHDPDSLRSLVSAALGARLDLVSQMARLRADSGWERLIVPAFVYFFAQLYPFGRVNRPASRTAAAAGGCVLLRTETAVRARIPERIRGAVIDDVTLARAVKREAGGRIWLGLADKVTSVRPYERLPQLWQMVARSAYAQLGHNPLVLAGTLAGLALVYLAPPVTALAGSPVGAAAWAVMALTYVPMLRYYGQPPWRALALPATAALYLLMTFDSALRHHRGRGAAWKGRTYA
ncbi:hopene-associated glycosyltransferase HpnB [Streptomyces sp. WMMB 714]|uniref:glycosyltransferase n=1 Tax=Streptomyces sp. WMMB 714 TaxID=1286822 RepID=UPI0008237A9D|nr:glycosyltransferase [Streptomyces sp. WMMB 714]SCK42385.1 hopene-associated glycosyltransferase HpnB [Streptomyces sp. WMMB 714]